MVSVSPTGEKEDRRVLVTSPTVYPYNSVGFLKVTIWPYLDSVVALLSCVLQYAGLLKTSNASSQICIT